jgi:hypothetical protein
MPGGSVRVRSCSEELDGESLRAEDDAELGPRVMSLGRVQRAAGGIPRLRRGSERALTRT